MLQSIMKNPNTLGLHSKKRSSIANRALNSYVRFLREKEITVAPSLKTVSTKEATPERRSSLMTNILPSIFIPAETISLSNNSPSEEKEIVALLSMVSALAIKNKQIQKPISEISDAAEIERLQSEEYYLPPHSF